MISASLPSLLQAFVTDRLQRQRQASPYTAAGYRDCFRLLLKFAKERLGKNPSRPEVAKMVEARLCERHGQPEDLVFSSIRGKRLSPDAVEHLLAKYARLAAQTCPSLRGKRVTPHVCRHSAAMDLLQHGVDRSVIAPWLGHESPETTRMYLHADMRLKEQALSRTAPFGVKPGRYQPNDELMAFLEAL